ncbi:MAG: PEP-CTERM sorting domain-containing protein [Kiritimatiellae bacterium]|nr:PEP-CTERM sorting domain-containing protein [Kiritimatiellia bacterium]
MKKIAILTALAMAATASFAAINVQWTNYGFLSGADVSSYATQDADMLLWELVYTANSSITTPTLDTTSGAITYGAGDEVLSSRLWERGSDTIEITDVTGTTQPSPTITMDLDYATPIGDAFYVNPNYSQSVGGIYAAVFQYMADGSVYYEVTELNTDINWANTMSASDKVNFDMENDTRIATYLGQVTPVPEPATMSLLGLGALAMVIRRKLSK